jgi:hypothetical protein
MFTEERVKQLLKLQRQKCVLAYKKADWVETEQCCDAILNADEPSLYLSRISDYPDGIRFKADDTSRTIFDRSDNRDICRYLTITERDLCLKILNNFRQIN